MKDTNKFFSLQNTVQNISDNETGQLANFLAPIEAFARTTYMSVYVIDYHKKSFDYVSENPLFLCGQSADEVKEMGYDFYLKHVADEDLELLVKVNNAGFTFMEKIPIEERKSYSISYDFRLKNNKGNGFLVNHKLTPIFLTEDGKIWKAMCIVSLSEKQKSGNVKIYKQNENRFWKYNLEDNFWETDHHINISEREREILVLSTQGLTVNEIAERIFVSADTVKFHRRKLFEKLGVANITEALSFATNNKLL